MKSKKDNIVAWSNAKAEYRAMVLVMCEFVWLKQLKELKFSKIGHVRLICDNQAESTLLPI